MPDISKRVHLTKRIVDAAAPLKVDRVIWDDEVRGFGLRVKTNGIRSYVLQYRNRSGRSRRLTIAAHGVVTADGARQEARRLRAKIAQGADPASERQEERKAETLDVFAKRYFEQHAEVRKKPASIRNDRLLLRLHIEPTLGKRKVAEISREDVTRLHQSLNERPYTANRALALMSKMMNLAERWGIRPDGTNPCRHVERFKEQRRQRFLSSDELIRLGKTFKTVEQENEEHRSVVPALRLLLFTGARRGEVLGLRWQDVDWENKRLDLPDSKTGAKTIHLNSSALDILQELNRQRADESSYVIRGRRKDRPLVALSHAWERIRERANLSDVRLHDLRHSFASVAAGSGSSLPIIGALLGHTQPQTTARYAHLAADPLKEASARIGDRIAALMEPKRTRRNVIAIEKRKEKSRSKPAARREGAKARG